MRRASLIFAAAALILAAGAVPASAGSFALFGSYWDTDAIGETAGGGIQFGIPLGGAGLELDFRGTYYPDLTEDFEGLIEGDDTVEIEVEAVPVDVGVSYYFGNQNVQPYVGGGATYYILDIDRGELDDEYGFYGKGGILFGSGPNGANFFVEAMYRDVDGTVDSEPEDFDDLDDVDFVDNVTLDLSGFSASIGVMWRF